MPAPAEPSEAGPVPHATASRLPRFNSKRLSEISQADESPQRTESSIPTQDLSNADALLADGVHAMNETLAAVIEEALGSPMPSLSVRFRDVQLKARIPVASGANKGAEIPTVWTQIVKSVTKCVAKSTVVEKQILHGVTGAFKPGRITLVLGQPGSGKSSLMKLLSGRFPMSSNIELTGDIKYNDMTRAELLPCIARVAAYVDQRDVHYPRMTVKETLEFAHECCAGRDLEQWMIEAMANCSPDKQQRALRLLKAHHLHGPDLIITTLGLDNCKDTPVGSAMLRGVSGGERKRVTTGEMSFGMKKVQLMDEISTGLDSAATFDIVNSLKSLAVNFRTTVVLSLLQPSPEVFALFDDVLLLNNGHVIFHGEREQALPYFETLGFRCPPRRDVADFLVDLASDKQHVYEMPNFIEESIPYLPEEFDQRFKQSQLYQNTLEYIDSPVNRAWDISKLPMDRRPYRQTLSEDLRTLLRRQVLLTIRNIPFLRGRGIMVIVMAILYGTTYWQLNAASSQLVVGLAFSCSRFLSVAQASNVPTFVATRAVFYKQRGAHFFRSLAYVISASMSQVPFSVVEILFMGTLVYWMCGYVSMVAPFFVFLVTLFLNQMVFTAFFFCVSCISADLTIAQPVAMLCVLMFMLFSGFLIPMNNIPDYFIWVYWINPLMWCVRALSVSQYLTPKFEVCVYEGVDYCSEYGMTIGSYSLSLYDFPNDRIWVYYSWIYYIVAYIVLVLISYFSLEYIRYDAPKGSGISRAKPIDTKRSSSTPTAQSPADAYAAVSTPKNGDLRIPIANNVRREIIPVTLGFEDLWYSVPLPGGAKNEDIDLLQGVTGFALPGTMTALMGSSGAGKTTLMDVIAGRKTGGKIRGRILLNGYPSTDLAIRRCTGYCEQMDIHSDSATIREALVFSAFLRQDSSVSSHEKLASVDECIELLELEPIADKIIRGSSTEQMKRLTIGVELAAHPSILFMDEPTSGLDARAAKLIMSGVRKIANTGRTVVCTIHQPSSEVFHLFDSVLLLQRGGRMVFFGELGENSSKLIKYFEAIPTVSPIEPGINPATWMLECIGAGVGSQKHVNFADVFDTSDQKTLLLEDMDQDGITRPLSHLPEIKFDTKRAASSVVQLRLLCRRFFRMYWRTPTYNLTRLLVSTILGALFGAVYQGTVYTTYTGANTGVGMMFTSTTFIGMIASNSVMPVAAAERTAFYRERASQTYNALWYFVAGTVAEVPYIFLSGFLVSVILYPSVGFTGFPEFLLYWLIVSLNLLVQVYFGQLMIYLLPSIEAASIVGALINSVLMIFAGFNPPTSQIPSAYRWVHSISPPCYCISVLAALLFANCPEGANSNDHWGCQTLGDAPPQYAGMTLKEYIESHYEMKHDDILSNTLYLVLLMVCLRIMALLSLRYVNHLKR